jgi:hypothetical protein
MPRDGTGSDAKQRLRQWLAGDKSNELQGRRKRFTFLFWFWVFLPSFSFPTTSRQTIQWLERGHIARRTAHVTRQVPGARQGGGAW